MSGSVTLAVLLGFFALYGVVSLVLDLGNVARAIGRGFAAVGRGVSSVGRAVAGHWRSWVATRDRRRVQREEKSAALLIQSIALLTQALHDGQLQIARLQAARDERAMEAVKN